jgi:hypothetical protein
MQLKLPVKSPLSFRSNVTVRCGQREGFTRCFHFTRNSAASAIVIAAPPCPISKPSKSVRGVNRNGRMDHEGERAVRPRLKQAVIPITSDERKRKANDAIIVYQSIALRRREDEDQ